MSAEQDVKEGLEASAGLTALVSTRIFPDFRPEGSTLPCVVFGRVGTEFETTISGDVILTRSQMAIACMATTRTQAENVANEAHLALLTAGLLPQNREGDYDDESGTHLVTVLFQHIQT